MIFRSSNTGNNLHLPSEIPWRRAHVRHTTNELFVDIIETVSAIIPPTRKAASTVVPSSSSAYYSSSTPASSSTNAKPLVARVDGSLFISSHLSGIPEISLILNTGNHKITSPSFHPCVRYDRFENYSLENLNNNKQATSSKNTSASSSSNSGNTATFSFIPPDGKFLLASYYLDNVGLGLVQADLRTGLGAKRDEFEIRVWTLMSRETKYIENLSVNIVSDVEKVSGLKVLRVTTGDYSCPDGAFAEWKFSGNTPLGWNATFRGILLKSSTEEDEAVSENEDQQPPLIVLDSGVKERRDSSGSFNSTTLGSKSQNSSSSSLGKPRTKKSASSLVALATSGSAAAFVGTSTDDNSSIVSKDETKKKKKKKKGTTSSSSKKKGSSSSSTDPNNNNDTNTDDVSPNNNNNKEGGDNDQQINSNNNNSYSISENSSGNNSYSTISRKQYPVSSSSKKLQQQQQQNSKQHGPKPLFPTHITLSYKSIGQVPSGIKVQSLKINNARGSMDNSSKPFKGVRYITLTGDFVVR